MKQHLYELLWDVETDVCSFLYREFKVFNSNQEAEQYGVKRGEELNGGSSIEERAQDGYYFKYFSAHKVREIDGFTVNLTRGNH
jgi:hypothetical protein